MDSKTECDDLKRYIDAVKGRPLSWSLAIAMGDLLGSSYSGGDKLNADDRVKLQRVIDSLLARGVKPSASLLTTCQKRAQRRRV
jgi:hypothetical protein